MRLVLKSSPIAKISVSILLFSPLEQFDVIGFVNLPYQSPFFFNVLVPFLLLFCIFMYIVVLNYQELKLIPGTFQRLFEMVVEFIFNLIKQQIGREGYILFPFIFTLFNFILFTNLLSLIPFGIALTSHLIMILWLSLSICLSIFFLGLYIHNIQFLKIFIPECPILLLPMLIVIEIFSYIIRAFSLAIRLSANIMAGHTLVFIISSFITNMLLNAKYGLFFIGFVILLAVLILELGVAFLQAYVFTVLVCIYLNDALKGPSH
jgi:ATP synthase subunit 6